jgi:hypothetical protein
VTVRNIDQNLKNSLLPDNAAYQEGFLYAHIVKFEKSLKTVAPNPSKRPLSYAYITDGSSNIIFNDGSKDELGNLNGAQTYIANKLISVGGVSETTQARASNINIEIDSSALGTTITAPFTYTTSTITSIYDLVEAGFSEGDKLKVTDSSSLNLGLTFRIDRFTNNNKTAIFSSDDLVVTGTSSSTDTLSFNSEEVIGLLNKKGGESYAGYINREVFIYKAHIDAETGAIIGTPFLLFKGIISSAKLTENPESGSKISWSVSSHWGDFVRVNGRLTSDSFHRGLDGNGQSDPSALKRPAYAADLGFYHSEQAINIIAIYQVSETRTKMKMKRKWYGSKKYKLIEYQVEVDREADLRFNLEAKYLPVVYGVQKIDSIPIFVDTLKDSANTVFVAYAICEGEIGGLYDIYLDDSSSICIDEQDYDTRATQTTENTIDVLCRGRMDRGDTLNNISNAYDSNSTRLPGLGRGYGIAAWKLSNTDYEVSSVNQYLNLADLSVISATPDSGTSSVKFGLQHEQIATFQVPVDTRLILHSGKENQKSDGLLSRYASTNSFKVQSDYFTSTSEYWGQNHQVLDTAYVTAQYTISDGETQIPSLDFVVRGKLIDCYNYDYSYVAVPQTLEDITNFNIGDAVLIKDSSTNLAIGSTNYIADIFTLPEESESRIRLLEDPQLGAVTAFYVEKVTGGETWHLITYDHVEHTGSVAETLRETITANSTTGSNTGVKITIDPVSTVANMAQASGIFFNVTLSDLNITQIAEDAEYSDLVKLSQGITFEAGGSVPAGTLDDVGTNVDTTSFDSEISYVYIKDGIKLDSSASTVDDYYNGYNIELTRVLSDNSVYKQVKKIISYVGADRVAQVSSDWDIKYIPITAENGKTADTYRILSKTDKRVSLNPSMQLLDYLTNTRYGKGLSLKDDIRIDNFRAAGLECDSRSDVTVHVADTATIAVGDIYYCVNPTFNKIFRGQVASIVDISFSETGAAVDYKEVTFTKVIGKLGQKLQTWKTYAAGEYVWDSGLLKTATAGTISSAAFLLLADRTLTLQKESGNAGSNASITISKVNANFDGNPIVKKLASFGKLVSGYSLYDSDDVKYWKYLGWNSQDQREVTRHQMNTILDTSSSLFDNINSMLNHFNGILRYSNGKYELEVETKAGIFDIAEQLSEEDIIGSINIEDAGQKGTFNTVTVGISDPQNRYESRSISFFDSKYLIEDRNVSKKGDFKTPYVTNYFNARINARQYLEQSRYGLKISFTMPPKGLLLVAGSLIELTHTRFEWVSKQFRITNLTFTNDCLVQVTAEEHNDSAYLINAIPRQSYLSDSSSTANDPAPTGPTNLQVSAVKGALNLTWDNSTTYNQANYSVQIYRSTNSDFSIGTPEFLDETKGNSYKDILITTSPTTVYYWIRYAVNTSSQKRSKSNSARQIFSAYLPTVATAGVEGITQGSIDGVTLLVSPPSISLPEDSNNIGTYLYGNSVTNIRLKIGALDIPYDNVAPYSEPSFRVSSAVGTNVTAGTITASGSEYVTYGILSSLTQQFGQVEYSVILVNSLGEETTFPLVQTVSSSGAGGRGPGRWNVPVTSLPTTNTQAIAAWATTWANKPGDAVAKDQAWFFTGTESSPSGQNVWIYDGAAWAEQTEVVDGSLLIDDTVGNDQIAANAVNADKIAANAITTEKLATASVTSGSLGPNAVTGFAIASGAVAAENIVANAITTDKLSVNAVTANTIAANAITTDKLAANAITTDKLAANSITANSIAANSVTSDTIAANSIITEKLAANAVNANSIAANSVTTTSIAALSVTTNTLAANAITTDKLATNSVITDTIAANSINAATISSGAVTTIQLASNSVLTDKLAANAVTTNTIAANAVTTDTIAANAITTDTIAANAITTVSLATGSVTAVNLVSLAVKTYHLDAFIVVADKIAANAVNADKIAANSITAEAIAANSINANKIAANSITADAIAANAITSEKIFTNAIQANHMSVNSVQAEAITANAINANKIAANAITTDKLAANAINANKIAANAITTEKLAANAVTANSIAANSVTSDTIAANSITAGAISANSIVSTLLTANAVLATDIETANISAITANLGDITAGTLKGGNIPDANSSPTGSETGAYMDLNVGRMVFGNASKHILFDGNDLVLSGVTIDAASIVDAAAGMTVLDSTVTYGKVDDLNFGTNLSVTTVGTSNIVATINGLSNTEIRALFTAGTGLSVSGGSFSLDGIEVDKFALGVVQTSAGTFADNDTTLMTSAAIEDKINATNTGITLTAGTGLAGGGSGASLNLDLDFSELTDMTADIAGTTEFILQNSGVESRKAASEIKLSNFNNDSLLPLVGGTLTGALVGTTATFFGNAAAGTNALNILGSTNGNGTGITFSDNGTPGASASGQNGYLTYYHADGSSYGSGNAFILTSSESTTTILADGKLMYKEGIYSKPASGTGAGTRKDANWDTAYGWGDHSVQNYGTVTSVGTTGSINGITLTGTVTSSGTLTLGGSLSGIALSQLQGGSYQTSAEAFADNDTSLMTSAAINDRIIAVAPAGTVTSVGTTGSVNGITLTGTVTSSGNLTLGGSLSGITLSQLAGASYQTSSESFADNNTSLMTSAAIQDKILSYNYSTTTGTVTSVTGSGAISVSSGTTTPAISVATASASAAGIVSTGTQSFLGNKTFSNNVIVSGNLTVNGTTTTVNTEQILLADNIITLNSNFAGTTPTESAGLEVERGSVQSNALFQWKESGVGETGDLDKGWSFGAERLEASGFYGTFYGDAAGLTGVTAADLTGLSTVDLAEDPSATVSSGTMYYTDARAQASITAGNGLGKSVGTLSVGQGTGISVSASTVAVDTTVLRTTGNQSVGGTKTFSSTIVNTPGTYSTTAGWNKFTTPSGYIQLGPNNTTWAHIYTDRGNFYFNKNLHVLGDRVWHAGDFANNSANWNTAFGWGNHASAGYYSASNPNGYTNDQTAAEILTAIKTVDGSTSGLDSDLLDGLEGVDFDTVVAQYVTTASSVARYKITLPFLTTSNHMLKFTISQYSSYVQHTYEVSGYLYGTPNNWYAPVVRYSGTGSPDIVMGRDANGYAYVSIAGGNYTGIIVHNVTSAYAMTTADRLLKWTITADSYVSNAASVSVSSDWNTNTLTTTNKSNYDTAFGWGNHASAGYVTSSGNTIIGTDTDLDTSGSTIIDNIYVTDGVITSMGTRVLTLANLGFTGATNANYITNNNQLTNGSSYITASNVNITNKLPLAGGTLTGTVTTRDIFVQSAYALTRGASNWGHLEGTYNNIGSNETHSNPIYTIGSSYNPALTTLSNMYGIGYTYSTSSFLTGNTITGGAGWGMYVASDGDARIFLNGGNGTINSTGQHYAAGSLVYNAGNLTLATLGFTGATNANYITNNNQLTNGASYLTTSGTAANSQLLDNYNSATASTASTVVVRDSSGDINVRLLRSEYDTTNATIGYVMTQVNTGTNNYVRPSTPTQVRAGLVVPTRTGGDASGTWGISVTGSSASTTGNAATATALATTRAINGVNFNGTAAITVNGLNYDVNNSWLRENGDNANVKLYGNSRQMAFRTDGTSEYASGIGAYPFTWQYGGDSSSQRIMLLSTAGRIWSNYHGWLDSAFQAAGSKAADSELLDGIDSAAFLRSNTADTFTGTLTMGSQVALVANNYGRGVFGLYDATKYQHVWSMGAAYKLADAGTSTSTGGNLYGLAWSYVPNYSVTGTNQQARAGLGHQLLLMSNGTMYTALGTGMYTNGTVISTGEHYANTTNLVLHAGNYNNYSPTKTGGGASGSWAISVTGNAATVTTNHSDGSGNYPIVWRSGGTVYYTDEVYITASTNSITAANITANTHTIGSGGTWFSDASGRIATVSDFYVQQTSASTYLYSTNTYLGNASGDTIRCRANTINGDNWSITASGAFSGNAATATSAASATLAANSTLAGGLAIHTGVNNNANKIVRTNSNGYIMAGWINTVSGGASGTITRVYCSEDSYVRYLSPAAFTTSLNLVQNGTGSFITNAINVNTINANKITANTITATQIAANAITASEAEFSSSTKVANSIFMNANGIAISDASNTTRVKIGNLSLL